MARDIAKDAILARCKAADIPVEETELNPDQNQIRLGFKCGRNMRWLSLVSAERIRNLASVQFEDYVFLADYEAICSYKLGSIEAAIRPITVGFMPSAFVFQRLFNLTGEFHLDLNAVRIVLETPLEGMPRIELSTESEIFSNLIHLPGPRRPRRLTLKLDGCRLSTHDNALSLLTKSANSVFFQIDMLTSTALSLVRARRTDRPAKRPQKQVDLSRELQYPKTEFDDAPLSLYWYAKSAAGMPLLQFLAFYQVIEFYFPTYSQAAAQRKLKAVLKDPTFRGDRDADIGKLLTSIQISRSGAFGDERSQLRATLVECLDPDGLRGFIESDPSRNEFYSAKSKVALFHKVPVSNPNADLRQDVADRIYDIRCKIVHSKADSRDGEFDLLLPFSKEAEQLAFDIELVQYVAQLVLISGSTPFQSGV